MTDGYDDDIEALINGGLAGDFAPLDRDAPGSAIGALVVNWRTLEPENAQAAWAALREWVEWFTVRYNIDSTQIPDCWWRHGALVEELSALHSAHLAAFDESDSGFGPIGWHERLALARTRWKQGYAGSCAHGHKDMTPRTWQGKTDDAAWTAWSAEPHGYSR